MLTLACTPPNRTLFYGVAEQTYRFSLLVCGASARPPSTDYTLVMKRDKSLHFPPAEMTTRRHHRCWGNVDDSLTPDNLNMGDEASVKD